MSEENERLEKQIHELQKEIAKLSSLLALKKFESEHPRLEKLANELNDVRRAFKREAGKVEEFAHDRFGDISVGKSVAVLGGLFLAGSIGYAMLYFFGLLGQHKR